MRVDTQQLQQQSDALRNAMRQIERLSSEVLRISQVLKKETVSEKFSPALQAVLKSMQGQRNDLKCLSDVLEQTAQLYEQCEQEVAENVQNLWFWPIISGYRNFSFAMSPGTDAPAGVPSIDWNAWDP